MVVGEEARSILRELLVVALSPREGGVYGWVVDSSQVTSGGVAAHFGCTLQNASGTLNKLWGYGLLRREMIVGERLHYVYRVEEG